jgi:DNA-directed RNA polymerase subunit L
MEIKILTDEKELLEVELTSVTIAEVVRIYLNKAGAKLAVWKSEHPTKNPVLRIEGDKPKKMLKDAISVIEKDIDSAVSEFKKMK